MAHITRIRIDGLLGREQPIEMELDRTVNVIFGENGCGKTTLLKILQSALLQDGKAMLSLPVQRAEVDIYSITEQRVIPHVWDRKNVEGAREPRLERERVLFKMNLDQAYRWKTPTIRRKDFSLARSWAHCFLPTTRLYNTDPSRRTAEQYTNTEDRLNEAFAESVNKRWLLYNTKILQEVRSIQEEGLRAVLYHSLSLTSEMPTVPNLNPGQAYQRVKKFLIRQTAQDASLLGSATEFAKKYASDEALRRVVDNINNVESRIEISMAPIEKFTKTINSLFSRNKKLQTSDNSLEVALKDGKIITPASLSSGEKHLLVILLNAMTAEENSVIIDEPELSMHIDWQHSLTETIATLNPQCQLILASHSPEIMANVPDEKIFKI